MQQLLTMEEQANLQRRTLTPRNTMSLFMMSTRQIEMTENIDTDHHERLRDLTREIDHLRQEVKASETEPMDTISHLECKCNRLALALYLSTPPEPLKEVLQ